MAASAAASSRRRSHGFLRLVAAAAVLAAFGLGAARAAGSSDDRALLSVASLFPGPACPTTAEHEPSAAASARMRIVHQHGPCSPLADAHGKPPAHDEILAADQNRVESIQRRVSATTGRGKLTKRAAPVQPGPKKSPGHSAPSSTPSLPATSGRALSTGNYVVTVGLGTPASKYTVVFDTGSDTTWVQCRPCVVKCYKQKEPLFDPAKSSTYANVSCSDPACDDLDSNGCTSGHCLYAVQYGDGSYTVGFFAQDTLTIAHDAIKGFRFGCGEKNSGLFGKTAGLMGLGRGKTSLTVQAYDKYGGAFAYCFPASSSGTGYLDFGPGSAGNNARLTPMLTDKGQTFYYVGMTGIRVGGQQVPAISQAQVCLAFASNGDDESVAIVGNTQQKTYGVLYDLGKKTVGFAPGSC